jgi:hypothetical protein
VTASGRVELIAYIGAANLLVVAVLVTPWAAVGLTGLFLVAGCGRRR